MKPRVVCIAFTTLLVSSVRAGADSPPRQAAAKSVAARAPVKDEPVWKANQRRDALAREGEALANQGEWEEARDRFQQVIDIRSHPRQLIWLGYCEQQLGHLIRAQALYAEARDGARAGKLKAEERDASEALSSVNSKIPRLTLLLPLDVEATILIDDRPIGAASEPILLDPGRHTVQATAPGREPLTRVVEMAPGGNQVVAVVLAPSAASREDIPRPEPRSNVGPILLGAGGIAGAGTGALCIVAGHRNSSAPLLGTGASMVAVGIGAGIGALVWGLHYNTAPSAGGAPGQTTIAMAPLLGGAMATVQGSF